MTFFILFFSREILGEGGGGMNSPFQIGARASKDGSGGGGPRGSITEQC